MLAMPQRRMHQGFIILYLRSLALKSTAIGSRHLSAAVCFRHPRSRHSSVLSIPASKYRLHQQKNWPFPAGDSGQSPLLSLRNTRQSLLISFMSGQREGLYASDDLPANRATLVDVDCNLWHKDLTSLLPQKYPDALSDPLHILEEDDFSHCAAIMSPSSTLSEAKRGLEILYARQEAMVQSTTTGTLPIRTTVGVHPYHVNDEECADIYSAVKSMHEQLKNPLHKPFIAAIGECGLDASPGFPPIEAQIPYFEAQVQVALQYNLPLFVHERLAFEECLRVLPNPQNAERHVPVVIHCFTGNRDECMEYVQRGYFLSISGFIFKDEALQKILEDGIIPLDRLMVETDAPYMGFPGSRARYLSKQTAAVEALNSKQRKRLSSSLYPNVPSSLPMVFEKVLEHVNVGRIRRQEFSMSSTELARITTANANRFFGFGLEEP